MQTLNVGVEGSLPPFEPMGFERMVTLIPEGASGSAEIKHFQVEEAQSLLTAIQAQQSGFRRDYVPEGQYASLLVNGELMMSDTPAEREENMRPLEMARGHVLIAGLGLGMLAKAVADKPGVESLTIVEIHQGVVDLVYSNLKLDEFKAEVVLADAHEWKPSPGRKFDTIFLDIWPKYGDSMLADMIRLKEKWQLFLNSGGWIEGWMERELRLTEAMMDLMVAAIPEGVDIQRSLGMINRTVYDARMEVLGG
jgi:hypothetical protein